LEKRFVHEENKNYNSLKREVQILGKRDQTESLTEEIEEFRKQTDDLTSSLVSPSVLERRLTKIGITPSSTTALLCWDVPEAKLDKIHRTSICTTHGTEE